MSEYERVAAAMRCWANETEGATFEELETAAGGPWCRVVVGADGRWNLGKRILGVWQTADPDTLGIEGWLPDALPILALVQAALENQP